MTSETRVDVPTLSDAQWKAIRFLSRSQYRDRKVAGYGAAPMISACRALVRKELAFTWTTGHYGLTDAGKSLIAEAMKRKPDAALSRIAGEA